MNRSIERARLLLGAAALSLVVSAAVLVSSASAVSFSNSTTITISSASGAGTPSPSTINVSGITGSVTGVRATLNSANQQSGGKQMEALLRGPGGQTVVLMDDACAGAMSNLSLGFDSGAGIAIPATNCTSGLYKPNDYGAAETTWTGGPAGPYGSSLSALAATPNGNWDLFTRGNGGGEVGASATIGGWTLELTEGALINLPPVQAPPSLAIPAFCKGEVATKVGTEGADDFYVPSGGVISFLGGDDQLSAKAHAVRACGDAGNDDLSGSFRRDKLFGGEGDDNLHGKGRNDILNGGPGKHDLCNGGAGNGDIAVGCETLILIP